MASGPSSVISGGHGTVCGINTDVVIMRPRAHPLRERAAKRIKPSVVSRKRATGRQKRKKIEKGIYR